MPENTNFHYFVWSFLSLWKKFTRSRQRRPSSPLIVVPVQRQLEAARECPRHLGCSRAAEVPSVLRRVFQTLTLQKKRFTNRSWISVSVAASPDPSGGGGAGQFHSIFFPRFLRRCHTGSVFSRKPGAKSLIQSRVDSCHICLFFLKKKRKEK